MSLLEVTDLHKSFGKLVAVDGVSFHVDAGEIFGLLGPNGAGKSTTMMMLAGLLRPDSGTIHLDGEVFDANNHKMRAALGVVPQDLAIYPDLTARENLNFFGQLYGIKGKDLIDRTAETLQQIGLTDRAEDVIRTFSGGMKRRLNFGVALLHRPRLLILDEPTVGVDPQSRFHLLECVRDLAAQGTACIYASHYMEEVQSICQRVAIIDHGKMKACDTLHGLLGRLSSDLSLRIDRPPVNVVSQLKGLAEIEPSENGEVTSRLIISRDQHEDETALNKTLLNVVQLLDRNGIRIHAVETHEPNLERLFLQLTGSRLRD